MVVILYTIMYMLFIFIDIIPIIKKKRWKVLGVYSILFLSAYVLTVMVIQGAEIPSLAMPLQKIVQSIKGK